MKRIWTRAEAVFNGTSWHILLDGKPVKKPNAAPLAVALAPLAQAIAAEWQAGGLDGRDIKPDDLPLTRMATTAMDRTGPMRADIITSLAAWGMSDMLCYRATEPLSLVEREQARWQPWLDWCASRYGVRLNIGTGLRAVAQPPEALEIFTRALGNFDDNELTALSVAVPVLGSLVLGLALVEQHIDAQTAFEVCLLEENFQTERWGSDELAEERRLNIQTELRLCVRFLQLCKAPDLVK